MHLILQFLTNYEILLYGDNNCNEISNKLIIKVTIAFIRLSKRFDT